MADPAVDPFAQYDTPAATPAPTNDNAQPASTGPAVSQQLIPVYDQSGQWTGYRRADLAPGGAPTPDQAPAVAPTTTPIAVKGAAAAPAPGSISDTVNQMLDQTAPGKAAAVPPTAPAKGAPQVDPFAKYEVASPVSSAPATPAAQGVQAVAPGTKTTGMVANVGAGTSEAVSGLLGLPVDTAAAAMNLGLKAMGMPPIEKPFGGAKSWNELFGLFGANPENVAPANETEALLRSAGRGAASVALPGGVASRLVRAAAPGVAVAPALSTIAQGAGVGGVAAGAAGGVTGTLASQAVPDPYKPVAELVGNVIGGGVAGELTNAAAAIGRGINTAFRPSSQVDRLTGQILNEAAGNTVPNFEPSPIPGAPLNIAQSSGSPELAGLVDTRNAANVAAMKRMQTAQNTAVIGEVPGTPGTNVAPEAAAARGSTRFTSGVQSGTKISNTEEGRLWNTPALKDKNMSSESSKKSVADAILRIQADTPGLHDAMNNSGVLRGVVKDLTEMSEKISANELNSIASRFKKIGRDPNQDDNVRLVAKQLGGAAHDGLWNAPEVTGRPARTIPGLPARTEMHAQADGTVVPVQIAAQPSTVIPAVQPIPALVRDLTKAREFTRHEAETFGHASFDNIVGRNSYGNQTVTPGTAANRFFDFANGTERPGAIRDAGKFLNDIKSEWLKLGQLGTKYDPVGVQLAQTELKEGLREYIASRFLSTVSTNNIDAAGQQMISMAKAADFLGNNRQMLERTGVYTPAEIDAWLRVKDYARMINRGDNLGRPVNSATFTRLMSNKRWLDMFMPPLVGHVAGAGIGAALGGTIGNVVGEGALGAILGAGTEGGGLGTAVLRRIYDAPREKVMERLDEAISDPVIAKDLMQRAVRRVSFNPRTKVWIRGLLTLPTVATGAQQQ
jgi:hypothetical protein